MEDKEQEAYFLGFPHVLEGPLLRLSPGSSYFYMLLGSFVIVAAALPFYSFYRYGDWLELDILYPLCSIIFLPLLLIWYFRVGRFYNKATPIFFHRGRGEVLFCAFVEGMLEWKVVPWESAILKVEGSAFYGRLHIRPAFSDIFAANCMGVFCFDVRGAEGLRQALIQFMENPQLSLEPDEEQAKLYMSQTKHLALPPEILAWGR